MGLRLGHHPIALILVALAGCDGGHGDHAAEVSDGTTDMFAPLDMSEPSADTVETIDGERDEASNDSPEPVEVEDTTDDTFDSESVDASLELEVHVDTLEDVADTVDATIATGELVVRVADDVNQDGFISPLDALLLINGAPGGVVGASVSVFDAADLLVATGLTTANPSPLVLVLPVGCYRVEAGDRDTPLLSIPSIDGRLCLSSGGRESATFLDVPASTDGGG